MSTDDRFLSQGKQILAKICQVRPMPKTPRGRLRELNNQGNLGYLKSGRGRLRERWLTRAFHYKL